MSGEELLLSVVIPSRDRPERLVENLLALAGQEAGGAFEVIVIDDGSAPPCASFSSVLPPLPYSLRFARQPPKGPAAARNLGIGLARGERILLLGDDTRPAPGCLALHLQRGAAGVAVQGYIDWDPGQEITPLMAFLAPEGPQFYFAGLEDGMAISYRAVLGSNFSAPRAFFAAEPFDEDFAAAAVEDTELAYRWQRRGFPIVFCRDAVCWHHHHYAELAPFLARQERAGRAARLAAQKHRGLWWPLFLEPRLYTLLLSWRRRLGRRKATDEWDLASRRAYFRGFGEGLPR
jgi:GT2 family glycosyltransferase